MRQLMYSSLTLYSHGHALVLVITTYRCKKENINAALNGDSVFMNGL